MRTLTKLSYLLGLFSLLCMPQLSFSGSDTKEVDPLTSIQSELPPQMAQNTIAKNYYKKNGRQPYYGGPYLNQWTPYFAPINLDRPYTYPFLQVNIGIGFLRFSGVKGGLARSDFPNTLGRRALIRGRLAYSRTPLVEVVLGYSPLDWFQFGLSYQHQGDIDVQTKPQLVPSASGTTSVWGQFSSSLRLDAISAKVYFTPTRVLIIKAISINPYLGVGVGAAWQSWTNIRLDGLDYNPGTATASVTDNFSMKNKYSCNCFFMADFGLKFRAVIPSRSLAVSLGCKYNQWGQARNIGLASQQRNYGFSGFDKQISIKTVYQFAPYVGFQFDF